jgi:hypothetical protein
VPGTEGRGQSSKTLRGPLETQAVRTEVATGSALWGIKYTLIMIICDGIILMFAIEELIQNTRISYEMCRLLLQRLSTATANKYMYKYCCGGTLLVAQLVEALRCKPEGRRFDSRCCHYPSGRTMALRSTQSLK